MPPRLRTRETLTTFTALLVAVPLALMGALLWMALRAGEISGWVEHTHDVIETLMRTQAATQRAQAALHSFLIGGTETMLAPWSSGVAEAWQETWRFKELTVDNPRQVKREAQVEHELADLFKAQEALIAQRRKEAVDVAQAQAVSVAALAAAKTLSEALADERELLRQRRDTEARSERQLRLGAVGLFALLVVLALALRGRLLRALEQAGGEAPAEPSGSG